MSSFVDTSALYALLDTDDANHQVAVHQFVSLRSEDLVTHNYVIVETAALVQRRLGLDAVARFVTDISPILRVVWIDEDLHSRAMTDVLTTGRRQVSLVDRVSFEVMRRHGVATAFAFDDDFLDEGFDLVPSG